MKNALTTRQWLAGCFALAFSAIAPAQAACENQIDEAFAPQFENSGTVLDAAVQSDNRTVIVGYFQSVDGVRRSGIARLNADGSLDDTFQLNAPAIIHDDWYRAVAVDPQGRILLGGNFFFIATPGDFNDPRQYLARLAPDGTLDATFDAGSYQDGGIDGEVRCIAVQADGKILVGGEFTQIHGVARAHIARLNSDGSLDTTFDPGQGADDTVRSIVLRADGSVIIGGVFSHVDGQARNGLARLGDDGALDTEFATEVRAGSEVHALCELSSHWSGVPTENS